MNIRSLTRRQVSIGLIALVAAFAVFAAGFVVGDLAKRGSSSTFKNTSATFPSAATTGVPAGATLTAYTGPLTITSCGTVIDHKIIPDDLSIRASNGQTYGTASAKVTPCVTLTDDLVKGAVLDGYLNTCQLGGLATPCGPVLVQDSEIAYPNIANNVSDLGTVNYDLVRSNVHGGRIGANCDGFCELHDSYVHDEGAISGAHVDGFITNGNSGDPILADHNTISCNVATGANADPGGCSGDWNGFGDNSAVSNVTVTNNLFPAGDPSYCVYTGASQPSKPFPTGTYLTFVGNIWQRGSNNLCGQYGPVADWTASTGDVWCNNTWDAGGFVDAKAENCSGVTIPTTTATVPPTTTTGVPTTTTLPAATTVAPATTVPATTPATSVAPTVPPTVPPSTVVPTTGAPSTAADPSLAELRQIRDSLNRYLAAHGG